MSDGIDLRFRRSNQTFGTSLSFENDILSLLNNRGDVLSSVNIDLIKKEELPTANEDNLGVIYLYTGPDDEYKHGYFYECVENSGVYSWENIVVQDSYLKSETYNKTETDTELAKKLNTDGSNTFTGVLKMRASISFKGAVAPSWSGIGIYELNDNDSVSLMASMEKTDGFTPASNNTYNIGVNSRKWKDLYLAGKAYIPTINNGADISVPASAGTMALTSDIAIGKNNITNCITKIPQDIKLELNNGTLTLKAGSKVYVPNGFESDGTTPKFDIVTIANDITTTGVSYTGDCFYFVGGNGTYISPRAVNQCVTFTTIPTSVISGVFEGYCLENNKMYIWDAQTLTWRTSERSFPIGIVNLNSTSPYVREIKQVFNGFGYIGSTVFALPDVEGLIPDGRNEDGTLKNTEFIIDSVKTKTCNSGTKHIAIRGSSINNIAGYYQQETKPSENYSLWYKPSENLYYDTGTGVVSQVNFIVAIKVICDSNGKITSFDSNNAFYAVDYNDREFIGHQAMPSDRYVNLTLGASGTTYTAPADGFFSVKTTSSSAVRHNLILKNNTNKLESTAFDNAGWEQGTNIKVKKGDSVNYNYQIESGTFASNNIYFIYAEGSK